MQPRCTRDAAEVQPTTKLQATVEYCEVGHLLAAELLAESAAAAERDDGKRAEWQLELRSMTDGCIMGTIDLGERVNESLMSR